MDLTWVTPGCDTATLAAAVDLMEAARVVDAPFMPPETTRVFRARVEHGWDGDPSGHALAWDGPRPMALLEVGRPRWDNQHAGYVDVIVHPDHRRRGVGRMLFEAGVHAAREEGRTLLVAECCDLPASVAFCLAQDLQLASREAQRRLDVGALDWPRLHSEFAAAEERAAGYELVHLTGPVPEDILDDVAALTSAINDAPLDDLKLDDEVYSAERIRAFEAAQAAAGRRMYRLAARHRETGELAGHTVLGVEGVHPWHGWQFDTSVARTHRGHRLGVLLKVAMLRWLVRVEPQLRTVDTWNAESNQHMILVNDLLGCTVIANRFSWQRVL